MKTYEKPKLIALSLSGNNMLCNTCAVDIIGNNMDPVFKATAEIFGIVITENSFASSDPCVDSVDISGYCKFTGANVVINS